MTLWLILTAMLGLAGLALLVPFLRRGPDSEVQRDVAFFRDQIRVLDDERARGALDEDEAKETRSELERRLVAAARREETGQMTETTGTGRVAAVALTMGCLAAGSAGLYWAVGRPDLAAQMPRAPEPRVAMPGAGVSLLPQRQLAAQAPAPAPLTPTAPGAIGDVDTMIQGLAARLEANPGDLEGWKMLAWSYLNTERPGAAADAYRRAVDLAPGNAELLSLYGEATVRAFGGVVTEEARNIFRRSLDADATNPRARFFEGMALEQDGQTEAALELWRALLADTPADADWREGLIARIREAGGDPGVAAATPAPGPTAADVAAAADMDPQDRQAMIRGMVAQLAERLDANPDDPEGWVRLVRSYGVLGDAQAQGEALAKARAALAGNAEGLAMVEAAARP